MESSNAGKTNTMSKSDKKFRELCVKLLSIVQECDDLNYDAFCYVWRKTNFSNVFLNGLIPAEMQEYYENIIEFPKQYILTSTNLKHRIAGIYLLYSFYFGMPYRPQPKIRMTFANWQNFMQLNTYLIDENIYRDALYMIDKLIESSAFNHCLCEKDRGLEEYYDDKEDSEEENDNKEKDSASSTGDTQLTKIFNELHQQSKNYNEVKSTLGRQGCAIPRLYNYQEIQGVFSKVSSISK